MYKRQAHESIEKNHGQHGAEVDQPIAALLGDLEQRGLLDETLVIWGGEFGRTPMVEASAALNRSGGRDHHPQAFTMWFAGGGMRRGFCMGETDELGFNTHTNTFPARVSDCRWTCVIVSAH